jgi:hypothetical protein
MITAADRGIRFFLPENFPVRLFSALAWCAIPSAP